MKNKYSVVGLMSGTSLDGLDIVLCEFEWMDNRWNYNIHKATTVSYPDSLGSLLASAHLMTALDLAKLNVDLGRFFGMSVKDFSLNVGDDINIDFIASHGHTVFHNPQEGYTVQIGCLTTLAVVSGRKVVGDFRSLDVALGGQGAPLVPIGDKLLFSEYKACLNLGGFANVSMEVSGKRIAGDICPVNFVMNHYVNKIGLSFDDEGKLARSGAIHHTLLNKLENLLFYKEPFPKSLGREWVEDKVFPLIDSFSLSTKDILATYIEHVAIRINVDLENIVGEVLVTGGGTFNSFLFSRMEEKSSCTFIKNDPQLIDFKEALIFAFLGVLKHRDEINVLASVTGAKRDSSSGVFVDYNI